ncbi:hypothetical protein CMV_012376 [Castanea mollissima]|uniref:Uncharacterized protein n=1 Tax=Castanea mollissima TaxID=60419 RepID=A0A8J4RIH0_9ROSI|nr:hypothetical protein CMV_012376 [Castanea mollissima]
MFVGATHLSLTIVSPPLSPSVLLSHDPVNTWVSTTGKWKDIVDEWVKLNQPGEHTSSALMADGDSPQQKREQQQKDVVSEKLASARKRLQENYKEAENAKRQRTIQVMDIHEIPKPKNAFFGKNKGGSGGGSHWRHW